MVSHFVNAPRNTPHCTHNYFGTPCRWASSVSTLKRHAAKTSRTLKVGRYDSSRDKRPTTLARNCVRHHMLAPDVGQRAQLRAVRDAMADPHQRHCASAGRRGEERVACRRPRRRRPPDQRRRLALAANPPPFLLFSRTTGAAQQKHTNTPCPCMAWRRRTLIPSSAPPSTRSEIRSRMALTTSSATYSRVIHSTAALRLRCRAPPPSTPCRLRQRRRLLDIRQPARRRHECP